MSEIIKVFLFGAWAPDQARFRTFVGPRVQQLQEGYILGRCVRGSVGYPLLTEGGNDRILGWCVEILEGGNLISLMDSFFGLGGATQSPFRRIDIEAFTLSGASLGPHLSYCALAEAVREMPKIPHGDWHGDMARHEPIPEAMSSRQKEYIRKLGRSSSRDIVPIDLDLYRELMKLGLIIDKGRRLALTPLGREVFRHLG